MWLCILSCTMRCSSEGCACPRTGAGSAGCKRAWWRCTDAADCAAEHGPADSDRGCAAASVWRAGGGDGGGTGSCLLPDTLQARDRVADLLTCLHESFVCSQDALKLRSDHKKVAGHIGGPGMQGRQGV